MPHLLDESIYALSSSKPILPNYLGSARQFDSASSVLNDHYHITLHIKGTLCKNSN